MNRNKLSFFILMLAALVVTVGSLDAARGGRGGGGGVGARGGGAYRGGQTMNRTPTMTRAQSVNRPQMQQARPQMQQVRPQIQQARPQIQQARPQIQQARPQVQQARQQIQSRPQIQTRPQTQQVRPLIQQARANQQPVNRDQLRNQVSRQSQGVNSRLDQNVLSQRQTAFSNQHLSQRVNNNQLSLNVSDRMRSIRPGYNQWFDNNFFQRHNLTPDYGRPGVNWWRAANWAAVSSWGAWNWATPYYYDDEGYSLAVTTPQESYPQDSYSQNSYSQGVGVQGSGVQGGAEAVSGDWMPLGVFAMGRNASEAAMSNRILQLALNRNGEISGVVYNSAQDSAQVVVGAVDANSQQAFWSLADRQDSPIVATGLYNLTEAQTPINVMFSDGSKQSWVLVRLQN